MTCAEEGCGKDVHARGLCSTHYGHIWRNNNPQRRETERQYSKRRSQAFKILADRHRGELMKILRDLEMSERRQRLLLANAQLLAERKSA